MKNKRIIAGIAAAGIVTGAIVKTQLRADILERRFSNEYYYGEVGTWGYLADDLVNTVKDFIPVNQQEAKETIDAFEEAHDIQPYTFEETKDVENVVYIQLEGVDAATLDLQVGGEYVTPNLHNLKENGIYLSHAYDQTGSGRTSDGEFLSLTSLLPVQGESMYLQYSFENLMTLPKVLEKEGYLPISIHGYEGGFYNRRNSHQSLGFERSYFEEDMVDWAQPTDYLGWGLSDEFLLNQVFNLLNKADKQNDGKRFIHAITLTNHHPFDAATGAYEDELFTSPQNIVEYYLNSVRYTDEQIGTFVKKMEESGIMDKTLLVIFSDHDSGITESLYQYFDLAYDVNDKECDRVPVVIYDGLNSRDEQMLAGQADIAPIVLSYLGIPIPDSWMGLNYVDGGKIVYKQGGTYYSDGSARANQFDMETVTKSMINYKGESNE